MVCNVAQTLVDVTLKNVRVNLVRQCVYIYISTIMSSSCVTCYTYQREGRITIGASHKSRGPVPFRCLVERIRQAYCLISANRIEGKKRSLPNLLASQDPRGTFWRGSNGRLSSTRKRETPRAPPVPCPLEFSLPLSSSLSVLPYVWILLFPAAEPQSRSYLT